MYRLRDAGFKAYLVGGGVRDLYLGKRPKDFDISTSARPGQVRKLFRNSRIIGRRFRLVQVFFGAGKIVEVSTFRRRSEYDIDGEEKVLAANNTFGNPAEDAFRRDLTINALFYEIEDFTVIDYTGGVQDLQNRIVRIVGDPDRRITRDPVRMMRVIRHAARASFSIEPSTWESICRHADKLAVCPVSRVRDELFKDLHGGSSSPWARLACDSGIFYTIFPFYRAVFSEQQDAGQYKDLLFNLMAVADRLVADQQVIPEPLQLSLLLLPWFESDMETKGVESQKDSYLLSKRIREELGEIFSRLNIKRGVQDSVARCLATMPLLTGHEKDLTWPKWLTRKSYFKNGLQLFSILREANGGRPVVSLPPGPQPARKSEQPKPKKRSSRGGSRGPALAPGTKGGVFGFRRQKTEENRWNSVVSG